MEQRSDVAYAMQSYQYEAQGQTESVSVRVRVLSGLAGLVGLLTMAYPIRPQLYFRRRDEMYGQRTDVRNVSSAHAGWERGQAGGSPGLLASWPSGLLWPSDQKQNPDSRPATWIRLDPGRRCFGYVLLHYNWTL